MSARNFYIMQRAVAPMQSEMPCYTPLTNHRTEVHTVPLVMAADYAALEAENARLVERTGYLVEFVQQMARQQGEPYYQKLAKAALKKWSGL